MTHSLALAVRRVGDSGRVGDQSPFWLGVFSARNVDVDATPLMASHPGSLVQREALVAHSDRWIPVFIPFSALGNASCDEDGPLITWSTFTSRPSSTHLPRTRPEIRCGLCGTQDDITREHCIPDWLATSLGITPVTARILCRSCNNRLGEGLEEQFASVSADGGLRDNVDVVAKWFLKTAVMLALACSVDVPKDLALAVRAGRAGEDSAQIRYRINVATPMRRELGFAFTVTYFQGQLKADDAVLCAFEFPTFSALVVRWPNACVRHLPTLSRASCTRPGRW